MLLIPWPCSSRRALFFLAALTTEHKSNIYGEFLLAKWYKYLACIMWITLALRSFAFIIFFSFWIKFHLNTFGCIWNHLPLLYSPCPLGIKKSSVWFQFSSDMWQNKQYWMRSRPTLRLMPSLLQQMANAVFVLWVSLDRDCFLHHWFIATGSDMVGRVTSKSRWHYGIIYTNNYLYTGKLLKYRK